MIIDINTWFGMLPYWPLRHNDPDGLVRQLDLAGIDRAFTCSLRGLFQHEGAGNRETLEAVRRHPDRLWPAFTFDPYRRDAEAFRAELEEADVRLVKLAPIYHTYQINEEPKVAELAEYCGERGIPIMLVHRLLTSQRFPAYPLPDFGAFISAHPRTRFIIATINYLYEIQTTLHILRNNANAYVETSGMMGLDEVEQVVREVGAERVLHGSCAVLQMPATVGPLRINRARISDEEKARIFSGNAIDLCGLGTAVVK